MPPNPVVTLLDECRRSKTAGDAFERWLQVFGALYGGRFLSPGAAEKNALRRIHGPGDFHQILFCVHTFFALSVKSAAARCGAAAFPEDRFFGWTEASLRFPETPPGRDCFKHLYHSLIPREVRHALGEYYTPDWLAEFILDEAGYGGDTQQRLLDPSCGTGTFLVLAIERARRRSSSVAQPPSALARNILANIWGFELNPLAALAARANYLLALGDLAADLPRIEPPVYLVDSILEPKKVEPFDFVVGNPPWVRWDYMPPEYRQATLPLWKHYGLFSLKGFQARLGAGKKDLSMLFTYAASDHYLKDGGALAFLITQEVFKSKGAGEGFRRFRLGEHGSALRVRKAHDFTKVQPFDGATNKTAAIILTKGDETTYPVPYFVWKQNGKALEKTALLARPLGSREGAWRTAAAGAGSIEGRNPYRAMLGANPNPYGVFWLEIVRVLPNGLAAVRNLVEKGKKPIPAVTATLESALLYPAIRGSDITRWAATPGVCMLVTQDPVTRCGYPEALLRQRWPRTFDYLSRFRRELLARALYKKYHQQAGHPFYSQFNVAAETFAEWKVVWKRMSNDLTAAVISRSNGPLGDRIMVPLETTAFIAAGGEREAHYLCAVINSRPVRDFVKSFSSAGRGFGTPSTMRHVGIPKFDPDNPLHLRLAQLSEELHIRKANGLAGQIEELESRLERVVSTLLA